MNSKKNVDMYSQKESIKFIHEWDPKERTTLGIVIPCYNEQDVVPKLIMELKRFATLIPLDVCVLFIDDGSTDHTFEMLKEVCSSDHRFAILRFSRNFGHQIAVTAGLMHVRGDIVAVIDADLQDPLDVIVMMIEKWREGFLVVYGIRRNRKENFFLRISYNFFYMLLKKIAKIDLPLNAGDFSLMDRKVVDHINKMPEHNRFVRGLRGWLGFKQIGISYDRQARAAGVPKYTLIKLLDLAIEGFISFSSLPLRLASILGVFSSLLGFLYMFYAIIDKLLFGHTPHGWASLIVVVIFFGGIQLIVIGIVGEYVGRIFEEVKDRPHYLLADTVGWVNENKK